LNGEIVHLHLHVGLSKSIVHASEHGILGTTLLVSQDSTNAAHLGEGFSIAVSSGGALLTG